MASTLKPIQVSGTCHTWRSPNGINHTLFLKLNTSCELDSGRGIIVVADENCVNAVASEVTDLRTELPYLLRDRAGAPVVYWAIGLDEDEIATVLAKLTKNPQFYG